MNDSNRNEHEPSGLMPNPFDRALGLLDRAQSVTKTPRPVQVRTVPPLGVGGSTSYSIQTYREAGPILEEDAETGNVRRGPATFTIFLEVGHAGKLTQIVIPDEVYAVMARQRDTLITQAQRHASRAAATRRKARGETVGNPEALRLARLKRSKRRAK